MVSIYKYNDGVVYFTCCDSHHTYSFADMIYDDCVFDVDVVCPTCGHLRVVYMLKCSNAAIAKELNAQLEVLKIRRKVIKNNDYKNNE